MRVVTSLGPGSSLCFSLYWVLVVGKNPARNVAEFLGCVLHTWEGGNEVPMCPHVFLLPTLFRNGVFIKKQGILGRPRKTRMTLNLSDLILLPSISPGGVDIANVLHHTSFMQRWKTDDPRASCILIKQSLSQLLHPQLFYNRDLYREVQESCSRAQNPTGKGWM